MDVYQADNPPIRRVRPQIWVSRKPLSNEVTIRLEYLSSMSCSKLTVTFTQSIPGTRTGPTCSCV